MVCLYYITIITAAEDGAGSAPPRDLTSQTPPQAYRRTGQTLAAPGMPASMRAGWGQGVRELGGEAGGQAWKRQHTAQRQGGPGGPGKALPLPLTLPPPRPPGRCPRTCPPSRRSRRRPPPRAAGPCLPAPARRPHALAARARSGRALVSVRGPERGARQPAPRCIPLATACPRGPAPAPLAGACSACGPHARPPRFWHRRAAAGIGRRRCAGRAALPAGARAGVLRTGGGRTTGGGGQSVGAAGRWQAEAHPGCPPVHPHSPCSCSRRAALPDSTKRHSALTSQRRPPKWRASSTRKRKCW